MEARLNAGPPRMIERAIEHLLPPLVREEVAGDLCERFRSPARYVADAAAALPYLIFSQIKRATNGPAFALLAFTIFASFGGFEPTLAEGTVTMWQRALVAALPALAALLLRDAYRSSECPSARRAAGDLAAMLLAVLAVEGIVAWLASGGLIDPRWKISGGFLIGGLLFSMTIALVLRAGVDLAPRTPAASLEQRPDAIELDYRLFRRKLRLRNAAELGALWLLIAVVLLFSLNAKIPLVAKVGFVWVALAVPIAIHRLMGARTRSLSASLDRTAQIAFYRETLARQREATGVGWWLCFGPLFAGLGLNMIVRGVMNGWFGLALGGGACIAVLAAMIAQTIRAQRLQIAEKIAALDRLRSA